MDLMLKTKLSKLTKLQIPVRHDDSLEAGQAFTQSNLPWELIPVCYCMWEKRIHVEIIIIRYPTKIPRLPSVK